MHGKTRHGSGSLLLTLAALSIIGVRAGLLSIMFAAAVGIAQASHLPATRVELTIGKDPSGDPELSWHDTCPDAGTDYAVYDQRDRIYSWDGPFMVTIDPTVLP